MWVDVIPVAATAAPPLTGGEGVVVIDVLRATSTAITALAHGCRGLVPVTSPAAARREAARLADERPLLGGERNGLRIKGFDLGNSPLEYRPEVVRDRVIIFCTTNGTQALLRAEKAARVFLAALLNASSVARRLKEEGRNWLFFCAGSKGYFSWEDFVCAGLVLAALKELEPGLALGDGARAALKLAASGQELLGSHADYLRKLGLGADVDFCTRRDVYDVVPVYEDGWLRPFPTQSW